MSNELTYVLTDNDIYPNYIPIGSVEFVLKYLKYYYDLTPLPKNIPDEILDIKFTGRYVINGTENDIVGKKFVKSNDKIKYFTEICNTQRKLSNFRYCRFCNRI